MAKKKKKEWYKNDWVMILIPVIILLVVLGTIFGIKYFVKPKPNYQTIDYNGFTFVNLSGIWMTRMVFNERDYELMFKYPPSEVENISIKYDINWFTRLTSERKQIYVTFDPEDKNLQYIALAAADISRALTRVYGLQPIAACTKNITEACAERPIRTCRTTTMPVIYLDNNPVQRVNYRENCLTIQGEGEDLLKAVEKVLLNWYKIIPDES